MAISMKKTIIESLKPGEYYIWNVTFTDGESTRVKVSSDYMTQEKLENHFKKPIATIDYSYAVRGGPAQDKDAADEYHRQQDELEKKRRMGVISEDESINPGDSIRTKKMSTMGVVEYVKDTPLGKYVFFRTDEGKLLKTPIENVVHDAKTEASMGGINRAAPAQDVSYEKVLDNPVENDMNKSVSEDINEIFNEVCEKWLAEQGIDEDMHRWTGYSKDDKKANALSKAPKSAMTGSTNLKLSELIRDSIDTHGLQWAFDYYVKKHGLPSRQFEIFAGLEPGHFDSKTDAESPVDKNRAFGEPTSPVKGSKTMSFSQMVADAIRIKGFDWAKDYFVNKRGIPEWEFNIFAKKPAGLGTDKEKPVAEGLPGSLSSGDYTPGATRSDVAKSMQDNSCKRCNGSGYVWKNEQGEVFADNRTGSKRYKCGKCGGLGSK